MSRGPRRAVKAGKASPFLAHGSFLVIAWLRFLGVRFSNAAPISDDLSGGEMGRRRRHKALRSSRKARGTGFPPFLRQLGGSKDSCAVNVGIYLEGRCLGTGTSN